MLLRVVGVWAGEGDRSGPPGRPPMPERIGAIQGQKARVLVVDDDPAILATVHDILAGEGWDVVAVESGAEAIDSIRTYRPALMLLDMRMPGMDGWAVARAARTEVPGIPIVVMTAAENAAAWASEVAADAHLAKPFALDDLIRVVERFRSGGGRPN